MSQNADTSKAKGLENIKHIVVLMFENRSFDHLFGDFRNVNGLKDKNGNFKEGCYNLWHPFEPPTPEDGYNPRVFPKPAPTAEIFPHDFTHAFGDGMMPDMFGPVFTVTGSGPHHPSNPAAVYTSGYAAGKLVGCEEDPKPVTYPEKNSGFLTTYNNCIHQGETALSYFKKGDLKILHHLADEFVVCDNWHCDMPGHTLPNRAFTHCGTTGDAQIDDDDAYNSSTGGVNSTSVFDLIGDQQPSSSGKPTWKVYAPSDDSGDLGQTDLRFLNPADISINKENIKKHEYTLTEFAQDCQSNSLPFYSFIMCWLPQGKYTEYTDTSMHPNSLMQPGENLLGAVYNTLRTSPYWENTLLMVTFDENGGMYDHVFPPTTIPPVEGAQPCNSTGGGDACDNNWTLDSTFDFSLLGFRIPALLISPWLQRGVDSTQYQNTSVLRFVIDKMNANYGTNASGLTLRDRNAPSLYSAFSQFGLTTMRTDCPEWIDPYPYLPCADPSTGSNEIPYAQGTLQPWTEPVDTDTAPPVRYINEALNIYIRPLPGHADSGKKIKRRFATNAEVVAYINERLQAAEAYKQAAAQSNNVMADATAG